MSFSRPQQPEFRSLVLHAWQAHCRAEGIPATPKPDRSWYEQELFFSTGQHSTADCNAGRDYDRAMAHFESIAGGSIKWQMRIHTGDAVRLLHELRREVEAYDIDEDYLRGVARRMLRTEHLPELERLTREQLILILGEVKRFCRRRLKTEGAPAEQLPQTQEADVPF